MVLSCVRVNAAAAVLVVSVSYDSKDVASGDESGSILIHSMDTGKEGDTPRCEST
tara:strand:+ start:71 stop:235 length:165 start_codon:yes stop_codon:yes gene_type:complete